MNKEVSAYLDCARLLGSLLVFFGHVELNWIPGTARFLVPIGNESLAVLFVVSGFVIGFVSDRREANFRTYFVHRAARAYSLLIPCVLFGFILDSIGKHFMTAYYMGGSWPPLGPDVDEALKALFSFTFLGEVWGMDFFPGSMSPYWTFPYEWTYYLLFGSLWYLRGRRRWLVTAVIALIAGPDILMLFPLWLLGVGTYRLSNRLRLSVKTGRTIFVAGMLASLIGEVIVLSLQLDFGFGAQESPDLWPFYLAGFLFAVTAIGFRFADLRISRHTGWVQWAAGASGTLYLLHFSLARFVNGLLHFAKQPLEHWLLLVIPVIAICLLFAELAERRREAWRRRIEAGIDLAGRLFQSRKAAPSKV